MPGAAPSTDAEVWRYSRIPALDLASHRPAGPPQAAGVPALPAEVAALVDALGDRTGLAITVDGHLADIDLRTERGFTFEVPAPAASSALAAPEGLLDDLHRAASAASMAITLARGTRIERPFVIVHLVSPAAAGRTVAPRLAVDAGEDTEIPVVEILASLDPDAERAGALVLPVTTMAVGRAASVRYLNVQLLGRSDVQAAHQASSIDADGSLRSLLIALGGSVARVRTDSALVGRGASSALLAAYLGDDDQQHDFRTMQHHVAPKTSSDLVFKGAVAGRAHSVYSGLIRIDEGAKGTKALQANRNLVLSEEAHADSVPNLEIDENDVSCSHASAVGPIDEQQRFYLEARGVEPADADRLIIAGFLAEVLDRCPVPGVEAPIARMIEARVEAANVTTAGATA